MAKKTVHQRRSSRRVGRRALAIRSLAVLAAAVLLVVGLARGGTWLTIHRLVSRIQSADDAQAARLVHELATLEGPAYSQLIRAAASPRSAVALAARAEVNRRLDNWQQQVYLHPSTFNLATHAIPLAAAIEQHHTSLSISGRRWARRVLRDLLALTAKQPFSDRLELVLTCDRVFSAMPPDASLALAEPKVDYRVTLAPPTEENRFAVTGPAVTAEATVETPRFRPAPQTAQTAPRQAPSVAVADSEPTTPERAADVPPKDWNPAWAVAAKPQSDARRRRVPAHSASTAKLAPPPTTLKPNQAAVEVKSATSVAMRESTILLRALSSGGASRSTASGTVSEQQEYAAEQLLNRGFGHVTPRDARMAISSSTADRLALVDLVLRSPRLESRKWLWRLAHDSSGEVRAAALASISTSRDQELIAAALELALRDTDPRVAEQASTLQARRR